jgi:hypothetical protein
VSWDSLADSCWRISDPQVRPSLSITAIVLKATVSERFWGWTENKREEERDFAELSQRAREGKPLYGESDQPHDIQGIAHRNSAWSALKFRAYSFPRSRPSIARR